MKLSVFVAAMGWISTFATAWLLLGRFVPQDFLSGGIWVFFLLTAFISSAISVQRSHGV